jgi:hypothetical protein
MKNRVSKKNMRKTISDQLYTVLSALKEHLGEKKFEKRIKKASKMLVSGIKKTPNKKAVVTHKNAAKPRKKDIVITATN